MSSAELFAQRWMNRYIKAPEHDRGCMIEGLAQELDFYGKNYKRRKITIEILRGIAAYMK